MKRFKTLEEAIVACATMDKETFVDEQNFVQYVYPNGHIENIVLSDGGHIIDKWIEKW